MESPYLSLVIPCYNEEENVPTLLSRVSGALANLNKPFEVILVDDGSTDRTPALLAEVDTTIRRLRSVATALALASDGPPRAVGATG